MTLSPESRMDKRLREKPGRFSCLTETVPKKYHMDHCNGFLGMASVLRVSKIVDYGTLVLTHMASYPGQLFSASDLASTLGLGQPVVSKVLKTLGHHDLVKSSRGVKGGYALSRAPERISIAEIIDALEEQPFGLTECSAVPGACYFEAGCQIRPNWQRINAIVRRTLEDTTLADMMPANPDARPRAVARGVGSKYGVSATNPVMVSRSTHR